MFDEDRAHKIDRDRYSYQWIPDRWPCDKPTGDDKAVHPDRRTPEQIAEDDKRWGPSKEILAQIAKDQAERHAEQMVLRDKYLSRRAEHRKKREKWKQLTT